MAKKLTYKDLKNFKIEEMISTASGGEVSIIGQDRAVEAIRFGLNMDAPGYNIFLAGEAGLGKTTTALNFAKERAAKGETPPDLCYVYNFSDPKTPRLITLKAGLGPQFKKDMEELIEELLVEIPKVISSPDFEKDKNSIVKFYTKEREEIIKQITIEAKEHNFSVKTTGTGIYFMPIIDGVTVTEEDYNNLDEAKKEEILKNSGFIQDNVAVVMAKISHYENLTKTEIQDMEYTYILFAVGKLIGNHIEKYESSLQVISYLKDVKEDVLDNLEVFVEENQEQEEDSLMAMLPWSNKKEENPLMKYKVNLIVDNSRLTGTPVIFATNPTYQNLIGEVEYDNEFGNFVTDFMKIKPGLLHSANGGHLILQAKDISIFALEALLRSLKNQEIIIEPLKEFQSLALNAINPEKLENLNVKVILLGSFHMYEALLSYDEDFKKLFKIRGDFDYEMAINEENISNILSFIEDFSKKASAKTTKDGIVALLEYSTRLCERQDKFSTNFNALSEILNEALTWAKLEDTTTINAAYIKKAVSKKEARSNLYEEKLTSLIDEEIIMISTTGEKVGQVNALAVIDLEDYAFAKPSRITATSYAGKSGVINIEKEARLSGRVHDKGVQVLAGYLGNTYAKEFPLSLSIRIGFEQNYTGIDGDSASSAELYAIISSIANIPITQEMAVTGSMNQHGEIQAIGGATHKIEGFFDTCVKKGLTGNQGVIIPVQNMIDLVLKDEVITAVKDGMFHVYTISHIDQGVELLTGLKSDKVHEMVLESLKRYSEIGEKEE